MRVRKNLAGQKRFEFLVGERFAFSQLPQVSLCKFHFLSQNPVLHAERPELIELSDFGFQKGNRFHWGLVKIFSFSASLIAALMGHDLSCPPMTLEIRCAENPVNRASVRGFKPRSTRRTRSKVIGLISDCSACAGGLGFFTVMRELCNRLHMHASFFFELMPRILFLLMPNMPRPIPMPWEVSRRLVISRQEAGISQETLARKAGITRVQLANIETERTNLKFGIGWKICETLDLNPLFLASGQGPKKPFPKIALDSSIGQNADFALVCVRDLKSPLTPITAGGNNTNVIERMPDLISELQTLTEERGMKTALADYMGVKLVNVSQWLSGKRIPNGEKTLRLHKWVMDQRAKQKSPGDATNVTRAKTRIRKSSDEKPDSIPPKP